MNRNAIRCCAASAIALACLVGSVRAEESHGEKVDKFAKCLAEKKAVMYGSFLCSHCDEQRKLFGESFKYIHYVECSHTASPQDADACKHDGIRFTPTWVFNNGERLVGVQTLKALSEKAACPLP
jgi:protein-disulfide isomerase